MIVQFCNHQTIKLAIDTSPDQTPFVILLMNKKVLTSRNRLNFTKTILDLKNRPKKV